MLIIKFTLSVLLVSLIVYTTDLNLVIEHVKTVSIDTVLLCTLLFLLLVIPQTMRWMIILGALDAHLGFRRALPISMVGWFFNQVLPTSFGGDAFRIWYAYRFGVKLGISIYSVITDRITGLVTLFMFVTFSLPWLLELLTNNKIATGFVIAFELIFISAFMVLISDKVIGKVFPQKITGKFSELCLVIRRVLFHWQSIPVILLSVIINIIIVFLVWLIAKNMSIPLSLFESVLLIPLVLLTAAIPISIAGWGVREGAMVIVLGSIGISSDAALALSVLLGVVIMLAGLPGGVVWILMHHETPHLEDSVAKI